MRALHRPDQELKKCNNCDKLFNTDKDEETYIEKYHITIHETLNEPELEKLPEITQEGNKKFLKIQVEDGEFNNTGELLNSDDEYDPKRIQMILNLKRGLTLKVNHS